MWIYFLIGLFFILLGTLIYVFKWYFLISGYNTMSKERKEKVNIKALSKLIGCYCFSNGIMFILTEILYDLNIEKSIAVSEIFFAISTIYLLVKAQTYDGNIFDENGKIRKGAGKQFTIPATISGVALLAVAVLVFFSIQPTKVSYLDNGLQIQGMYGEIYNWESIDDLKLLENLPKILIRTNGSALGNFLRGHFYIEEYKDAKLFINTKVPSLIYFKYNGDDIIFNLQNVEETKQAYEKILQEYNIARRIYEN